MVDHAHQPSLFEPATLPYGLAYRRQFLAIEEEAALLAAFVSMPFREARFQQYFARRRVVRFLDPAQSATSISPDEEGFDRMEWPDVLCALRKRVADWLQLAPTSFVHALVSEYRPGTPIGWHRDKPEYGIVVGVSLRAAAIMRFRPIPSRHGIAPFAPVQIELEPRSAYVMRGAIRWDWQHSMPAVKALRYSVTFRTLASDPTRALDSA